MTSKEKDDIKRSIDSEIINLQSSIKTLLELADSELQDDANDWFSSKESNISKGINEEALARAKKRLVVLNNLLKRIDRPDYGICTGCNSSIPFERMKAIPTATRCMKCS